MNGIQRTVGGRSIADQSFSIAELTSQVQAAQVRELHNINSSVSELPT